MQPVRELRIARDRTVAPLASDRVDPASPVHPAPRPRTEDDAAVAGPPAPPVPVPHRRQPPWLLVAVDADPSSHTALVWSLREAARREATVVAVSVCDDTAVDDEETDPAHRDVLQRELDARVHQATAEAGVRPRVRTAVLDAQVFDAFAGAARGADLVLVGAHGKTLLRPAVARPLARRAARPA